MKNRLQITEITNDVMLTGKPITKANVYMTDRSTWAMFILAVPQNNSPLAKINVDVEGSKKYILNIKNVIDKSSQLLVNGYIHKYFSPKYNHEKINIVSREDVHSIKN